MVGPLRHDSVNPLALRSHHGHCPVMSRWSLRRILALFLGLFLGLSMSLSAVQASTMAAKMSSQPDTMASMAAAGEASHGDCNGCGSQSTAKIGPCASFCAPSIFAMTLSITPSFAPPMKVVDQVGIADFILAGKIIPPDPHPPRSAAPL